MLWIVGTCVVMLLGLVVYRARDPQPWMRYARRLGFRPVPLSAPPRMCRDSGGLSCQIAPTREDRLEIRVEAPRAGFLFFATTAGPAEPASSVPKSRSFRIVQCSDDRREAAMLLVVRPGVSRLRAGTNLSISLGPDDGSSAAYVALDTSMPREMQSLEADLRTVLDLSQHIARALPRLR
jgi:hypothetical protein